MPRLCASTTALATASVSSSDELKAPPTLTTILLLLTFPELKSPKLAILDTGAETSSIPSVSKFIQVSLNPPPSPNGSSPKTSDMLSPAT